MKNNKIKNNKKFDLLVFKKLLKELNTIYLYNLYFFNISSFLDYLDYTNDFKFNSKKILSNIEKYIPLNIYTDDDIYSIFKDGIDSYDIDKISKVKNQLQEKALESLIVFIYNIKSKEEFNKLLSAI